MRTLAFAVAGWIALAPFTARGQEEPPVAPAVAPAPMPAAATPARQPAQPVTQPAPVTEPPAITPASQPVTDPQTMPPEEPTSRLPAYVALGVGSAGAILGAVFGGLAMNKKSSLTDVCGAGGAHCPSSAKDDLDDGKAYGTISTAAFVVGGVGLAAALYLFLADNRRPASAASSHLTAGWQTLKLTF